MRAGLFAVITTCTAYSVIGRCLYVFTFDKVAVFIAHRVPSGVSKLYKHPKVAKYGEKQS